MSDDTHTFTLERQAPVALVTFRCPGDDCDVGDVTVDWYRDVQQADGWPTCDACDAPLLPPGMAFAKIVNVDCGGSGGEGDDSTQDDPPDDWHTCVFCGTPYPPDADCPECGDDEVRSRVWRYEPRDDSWE